MFTSFQCLSRQFLKLFTDVADTTSWGSLFKALIFRKPKLCCLEAVIHLGLNIFKEWPRKPFSHLTCWKTSQNSNSACTSIAWKPPSNLLSVSSFRKLSNQGFSVYARKISYADLWPISSPSLAPFLNNQCPFVDRAPKLARSTPSVVEQSLYIIEIIFQLIKFESISEIAGQLKLFLMCFNHDHNTPSTRNNLKCGVHMRISRMQAVMHIQDKWNYPKRKVCFIIVDAHQG